MKKIYFWSILILNMMVFLPQQAGAQSDVSVWDGTAELWSHGNGTKDNPYLIENARNLNYIAEMVNGGVSHYNGIYFKLTTDIQIDSTHIWQPIGLDQTNYFGGNFDGNNHEITFFMIDSSIITYDYVGIFGYATNSNITNFNLQGKVSYSSATYVGGIVAFASGCSIQNCHSSCNVTGNAYTGGLVGTALNTCVQNCTNIGDIYGYSAGGIIGKNRCENTILHICGNSNNGTIMGNFAAGGIIGEDIQDNRTNYPECATIEHIYRCSNSGRIVGYNSSVYLGGIVGFSQCTSPYNYSVGPVHVNTTIEYYNRVYSRPKVKIYHCYNTGFIENLSNGSATGGGVLAYKHSESYTYKNWALTAHNGWQSYTYTSYKYSEIFINNCYNVGNIQTSSGNAIGPGTVTNCHYLNTCGMDGDGTSRSETQMKAVWFPIILNADSVEFVIDLPPYANNGYPIFGNVQTREVTGLGRTTATLNGVYDMPYDIDSHGFEYKLSADTVYTVVLSADETPTSYTLNGLQSGTSYDYRFYIEKNGTILRGTEYSFTTIECTLSANILSTTDDFCEGDTVAYHVEVSSDTPSSYQFIWNTGDSSDIIQIVDTATYSITVTDIYGCTATDSKQSIMHQKPTIEISGNTHPCEGDWAYLYASGGHYYFWNTGNTSNNIAVLENGTYYVTVSDIYGCISYDSVTVAFQPLPTITISGDSVFCQGSSTTLTASGAETYEWWNGESESSIIVDFADSYTVTGTDTNGCTATATQTVSYNPSYEIPITQIICPNESYDFFGQILTTAGTYSHTLQTVNGCDSIFTLTLMVKPSPSPTISGSTSICQGETTTLIADGGYSYVWSNASTSNSISVNQSGVYTVTATDDDGCSATADIIVTVNPLPNISISGNSTLCAGNSTTLTALGANAYSWSTGENTDSVTISYSGVYAVTGTSVEGCSNTADITVSVSQLPFITISGETDICAGESTTLTANNGETFLWNDGTTGSTLIVNVAGTYQVIGYDSNGCANSATKTVSVNPTYNVPLTHSICEGENYNFYGQNITAAGTYTHTLQTVNGCDSVLTLVVTLEALPTISISGNTTLCEGESTTLTANGGISYNWSNSSATNSINVAESGVYTVTATNVEGCSATATATVTVNPLPTVSISGNNSFCQGDNVTLTATGASTYAWNNSQTSNAITVNNAGTYTVTGTDANGCTNTATHTVSVNPTYNISLTHSICEGENYNFYGQNITTAGTYIHTLQTVNGCDSVLTLVVTLEALPTIAISGNTTLCEGESTTLTANGGISYNWSNGSTNNSISVSQSGVYTVTATNVEGCSATTNVTVTVNPLPTVSISGNNSFCQGSDVQLTATGASTYAWSNSSTDNAITVNNAGTYTVTGTDANGCSNTATKTVTVNPTYNVTLTHSMCEGESYNFYGQNITTAGTYTHTLQTVNGCDSVLTLVVTLEALPTIAISGNTMLCEGESTTLTANGGISYNWSNGSTNSSISISQSGVYTVTAINAEGCSASTNVTVTVNPLPNVNISGNSSFCQDDNVTLTATGANTYVWSTSNTDNAITVNNAGTYTVTGTDANGCSNTATKTVTVNPTYNVTLTHSMCEGESYNFYGQNITTAGTYTHTLQTVNGCDSVLTLVVTLKALPTIAISGNTMLCEEESTTLTANGGINYNWSNGSATNSINVAESGVYTVTATNVEGCSATANATVTVNPLPIVVIGGNTTICEGGSTTLTASGADTYSWSTGDNTASATISAFGIYNVTGTSAAGCSSVASVTVLVSQLPVITITGETDICAGESTTLTANGGTTYLWSNGTTDATLTVGTAGTYQVIGYNEAGCNAMASATVNVWQPASSEFSIECPDSCYTWNDVDYCQSGEYTQTFQTVHGCDSVVTLHLTITVGLSDHDGFDFKVYPNPTSNIVNVQFTNHQSQITEIQLVDAYGRLLDVVRAKNYSPLQTTQIDFSRYATGIYFIKAVADGKTVAVRKVVRN